MEQGIGIAYALLGLVMGFALGALYITVRSLRKVDGEVRTKLAELRADAEAEAQNKVRLEQTLVIRDELEQKYNDEIRAAAERAAARTQEDAEDAAKATVKQAKAEAQDILQEARDAAKQEHDARRDELTKLSARISEREDQIEARFDKLEARSQHVAEQEDALKAQKEALREAEHALETERAAIAQKLEEVAGLTRDAAKAELVEAIAADARLDATKIVRQIEDEATAEADKRAKMILGVAMQRWAGEYSVERAVNVVPLPSDDLKGRIIGREGRNIRALEAATGMDIIIDDTPEAVVVSGFNPVRRHIATLALQKMIADGRIHPSRIEEVVKKTEQEVAQQVQEYGERAAFELGIHGLHPDIIKLIGQLRWRTSYGQNMWSHSIEVGFLCGLMASELGLNVKVARRAGLLHDMGKALTHEQEGSHALVGAEIARKCGESEVVRNAIAAHHNEEPQNSVIAHLVIAADALSGARPGARREILETYVQRLRDLERISSDFEGVERSFAIQAGREIRVIVENSRVNDDQAFALSKEIARKIETELTYPGQIKVCVIRETRAVDYAR